MVRPKELMEYILQSSDAVILGNHWIPLDLYYSCVGSIGKKDQKEGKIVKYIEQIISRTAISGNNILNEDLVSVNTSLNGIKLIVELIDKSKVIDRWELNLNYFVNNEEDLAMNRSGLSMRDYCGDENPGHTHSNIEYLYNDNSTFVFNIYYLRKRRNDSELILNNKNVKMQIDNKSNECILEIADKVLLRVSGK